MKKLSLSLDGIGDRFSNDVSRIIQVCLKAGYVIDYSTAYTAWTWYSDSMAAGWMMLPEKDEEVLITILDYTSVKETK